jgi:hypothetical protein
MTLPDPDSLIRILPMPLLLRRLGTEAFAKASCKIPSILNLDRPVCSVLLGKCRGRPATAGARRPAVKIIELLNRLHGVRKAGNGFTARCPAHEDAHTSLSIREGGDGRVLVQCFAGCSIERISVEVALLRMQRGGRQ